jgi:hypothetical protein
MADARTSAADPQRTWNTPEDIERHREMTPEQRIKKAIELSRAALRFAAAPPANGR